MDADRTGWELGWSMPCPGVVVCRVTGDVDGERRAAVEELFAAAVDYADRLVLVDFSQVGFCDSSGVNTVLALRLEAHARGVVVCVAGITAAVARVFQLTGANTVVLVYDSVSSALADLPELLATPSTAA